MSNILDNSENTRLEEWRKLWHQLIDMVHSPTQLHHMFTAVSYGNTMHIFDSDVSSFGVISRHTVSDQEFMLSSRARQMHIICESNHGNETPAAFLERVKEIMTKAAQLETLERQVYADKVASAMRKHNPKDTP